MASPAARPSSPVTRGRAPDDASTSRAVSNARLASPVPGAAIDALERRRRSSVGTAAASGRQSPLPGSSTAYASGPGYSALADALNAAGRSYSPQSGTAAAREQSPLPQLGAFGEGGRRGSGAFAPGSFRGGAGVAASPRPVEDFEVIRRHLAGPEGSSPKVSDVAAADGQGASHNRVASPEPRGRDASVAPSLVDEDEFSSLRLQGGDMTRDIYRRTQQEGRGRPQRSKSIPFRISSVGGGDDESSYSNINQPGGFRREHIRRQIGSPAPGPASDYSFGQQQQQQQQQHMMHQQQQQQQQPNFLTRNFYEFLSLYGHFAGEDVDDDDDDDEDDSFDGHDSHWARDAGVGHSRRRLLASDGGDDDDDNNGSGSNNNNDGDGGERRPLLGKRNTTQRRAKKDSGPKKGAAGTVFILLKSFVGTGVLFLPRAFLNGGMLFSVVTLLAVSLLSYYCFLLLTASRLKLKGSFAQMGEMTYGPVMRLLVNTSLVVSQMGFASAYIVFTSENLQAFILAVSKCKTYIDIKLMILMQLVVFLPLSLYRNLNNISFIVYVADMFIVLGLLYLYYFDVATLAHQGGVARDVVMFNPHSWTLFIGTAIFTFEGIGLIIPIQDGMKRPQQLPAVLGGVMVIITVLFVSMGALAYAAFGSRTETVVLLNMPQDNRFVNGVQFIYSLAILLSTPMQIFPAITIMEKAIFSRSGKFSKGIKWRKNGFRFSVVMLAAAIAWVGASDLDKFVALVGSFACIPLVYIYPTLIHQKAVAERRWQRVVDWLLCVFGFVLMAYTTVLTVSSWVGGEKEVKHGYCD